MPKPVKVSPLILTEDIAKRVSELANAINSDFGNEPIVAIAVVKSALVFFSDLVRELEMPVRCEFLEPSERGRPLRKTLQVEVDLNGKNVLLVDTLVQTGSNIIQLKKSLKLEQPQKISTCALVIKKRQMDPASEPDYAGFEIGNLFVVGYGLDYFGRYRELPFIGAAV